MNFDPITSYYEAAGAHYRMSSTRRQRVLALIDDAIRHFPGETISILDIGIGSAEVAKHCRALHPDKAFYLEGVDVSQNLLSTHRALYDEVKVLNVDDHLWHLKLNRRYHVVVASELIEHLFRPDLFMKSLSGVLEDGGMVVLSTPNLLLWSHRIKFLLGQHAYGDRGVFEWGHIHLFSWPYLKRLVVESGLRIIQSKHLLYPNFLDRAAHFLPIGLFSFQFIILLRKR